MGTTLPPTKWVQEAPCPRVKLSVRKADKKVKNAWSCKFTPSYAVMACTRINLSLIYCTSNWLPGHKTKLKAKITIILRVLRFSQRYCCYEACPERKDTSRVGRKGNFLCLLWEQCRRPSSFTCEPCSFDSGRTGFVWVRCVWNGSADPKSCQMRGAFRHTISQRQKGTCSGNS